MAERGRVRVPTPARTPAGYGLLAAATVLSFNSPHEALGVEYESAGCGASTPWPAVCGSAAGKPFKAGPGLVVGDPFVVLDSFECFYRDDATSIAAARIALGAGPAVERALWTGVANSHPNFKDDATVVTATPLDLSDAMAVLQQTIGVHSPAGGVIHLPRGGGACLACCAAMRDGNVLRDLLGNAFALGSGYTATGAVMGGTALPAGASFWAVATGPVTIRRGPVQTAPAAFDTTTNTQLVLAEQAHVITVECGMWAVPVKDCGDLSLAPAAESEPPQQLQVAFAGEGGAA